jgi:hypothetical protein
MTDFPRTAFLLGAGLGTRLLPLTEHCPKPLLRLDGEPLVLRAMRALHQAGTRRFLINTHHCPDAWTQAFPTGKFLDAEVQLVHEAVLLDTGGGLANVAELLTNADRDLIVWNGDILSGVDLTAAVEHHRTNGAEATLVVREQGPLKNVRITDEGDVTDLRDRLGATEPAYQYTGICLVTRAFALGVPKEIASLVEHFLRRVTERKGSIQGYLDASKVWHDLGTLAEFEQVRAAFEKPVRGRLSVEEAAGLVGYLPLPEAAVLKGGSGRRFQRVANLSGHTAVLCVYDDSRPENRLYGPLARVLRDKAELNVPLVLAEDDPHGVLLLEDLGDDDLWSLAQAPAFPWPAFASAVEQAARLHRDGPAAVEGLPLMEAFGPKLYQWERDYFRDNVIEGRRFDRGAINEMESLAKELSGRPVVTIHRDFQSQNILVRDGEAWLIDFQGLRQGCAFYDYASLAFDPYLKRPDMDLWRIEIEEHAREVSEWKGSSDEFTHLFHVAATQRLLQACGAYAFLGKKQGRPDFLAHLPQGLRNLAIAASLTGRRKLAALAEDLGRAPVSSR